MKMLIVNTQSMNHNNATGITMRSIFQYFSPEDCFELYMQPCDRCKDALPIRSEQLGATVCPLRSFANKALNREVSVQSSTAEVSQKKMLKSRTKTRLTVMLDFEPIFITHSLIEKIKRFEPDYIYTLGNSIDTMKLCVKISNKFHINIIPHFMDNWQASHRFGADIYPLHIKETQNWLHKMYNQSRNALVISEKMAEKYQKRWGIPHYALMNTVDVATYHTQQVDEPHVGVQLVYAGGLHLNRYKSLLDIANAIESCALEFHDGIELTIYTDTKSYSLYKNLFDNCRHVLFHENVSHDQIVDVYKSADALIHIESFDTQQRDFIRYSLSTKISEYLATEKPILLYAPSDIFVSEYLSRNEAAIIISKSEDLIDAVLMLKNQEKMNTISSNAYELAQKYHDNSYLKKLLDSIFIPNRSNNEQN